MFPSLGNGGYDARDYALKLRYGSEPSGPVRGTVAIDAIARQDLSRFNLDFAGGGVSSVRVNGRQARFDWQRSDEELVIIERRTKHTRLSLPVRAHRTPPVHPARVPDRQPQQPL